jgi:1,4-alpha-glucan branching enzyme
LQPGKQAYNWTAANYQKPKKTDLVIYELLLRDFLNTHDYKTLIDTLDYLENLGINAIELMPFNEFEGNISWGYNPSFYFAPDKYYGTADDLKKFIDECHKRNIAVIMDMVLITRLVSHLL